MGRKINKIIFNGKDYLKHKLDIEQDPANANKYLKLDANGKVSFSDGETTKWGDIEGSIENQTGLIEELNKKVNIFQGLENLDKILQVGEDGNLKLANILDLMGIETFTLSGQVGGYVLFKNIDFIIQWGMLPQPEALTSGTITFYKEFKNNSSFVVLCSRYNNNPEHGDWYMSDGDPGEFLLNTSVSHQSTTNFKIRQNGQQGCSWCAIGFIKKND